ncbi:FAD-binding domain-containing protein [Apiospora marii]|uniref:FAD-binding domain-containing protein n=1 Tax=Apiospora marii TaxID=335849 RepID=UPI003130B67B
MSVKTSQAILALRQTLPNAHLVTPGTTDEYQSLNDSYLSGFESDLSPACIFLPKSKEEVAAFVRVLRPFVGDVQFAIRAAGRQPLPGCANVQDGITVDLRSLTGVEVRDGLVQVAAGESWGAVYERLEPRGLGVTGGIVTRFDFRTFKQGSIYAGFVWYFKQSFPDQMAALVKELTSADASVEAHLMLSIAYAQVFGNGNDVVCLNQLYYTQPIEEPPVLSPFVHVQPQRSEMNTMKIQTIFEATKEQSAAGKSMIRCLYMNVCVKADVETLITGGNIWCEELEPVKDAAGLMCSYTLQPYPVSQLRKTSENGGNVLGLDPDNGPVINVLLLSYWAGKNDDERVTSFMQKALKRIERNAKDRGTLVPFIYWNYAFLDQEALQSYSEENVRKLRAASKKYDPDGVFQTACPGGFKLFK